MKETYGKVSFVGVLNDSAERYTRDCMVQSLPSSKISGKPYVMISNEKMVGEPVISWSYLIEFHDNILLLRHF